MMFSHDIVRADAKRVIVGVIRVIVQGDADNATIKVDAFQPDRQGDSFINGIRMTHLGTANGKVDMSTGKMSGIIPNTLSDDVANVIMDGLKFVKQG